MNGEQLKKYIPDTAVHSMQIKDVKYISINAPLGSWAQ
jgi:hypothetical protein